DDARTRWFLNGAVISGTEAGVELSQNNRLLSLTNQYLLKQGRSEHKLDCKVVAESGRAFDQRSLKIDVIDAPALRPLSGEVLQPLGSELNLHCSQKKRNGLSSTIKWFFNGREVAVKRGRLVVKELSQRDYGVYQCEATNEAGSSMNTVWVKEGASQNRALPQSDQPVSSEESSQENEFGAPVITKPPKDVSFSVGSTTLKLPCVVTGTPVTTTTWRFNGESFCCSI
ncbi:hypothetical protein NECAME_09022, partial [Necator americanus]